MANNEILTALGVLPELVNSINAIIDESEKKDAFLAKMAETKVEAQVSEEGKQEILNAVVETIKNTPCAAPNVSDAGHLIAEAVREDVKDAVGDAVREKVKSMSIPLEHHHTHTTTLELVKYAEAAAKTWIIILSILCWTLLLWIFGFGYWYFDSEMYWGKRYYDMYHSEYITKDEKTLLWKDLTATGVLPKEYQSNPGYVKAKIKQNETVIAERRKQAKANGGIYSINVPIER